MSAAVEGGGFLHERFLLNDEIEDVYRYVLLVKDPHVMI